MDFAVPADDRLKMKEGTKLDKYLDLAWESKNAMEHVSYNDTNYSRSTKNNPQETEKKAWWTRWIREEGSKPSKQ